MSPGERVKRGGGESGKGGERVERGGERVERGGRKEEDWSLNWVFLRIYSSIKLDIFDMSGLSRVLGEREI